MSIFKVEFTLWVDDDGPSVNPRELVVEAVYAHNYRSTVLDWKETEMILSEAPWVGHMCEGCPECEGGIR